MTRLVKRFNYDFKPTFHAERLNDLKKLKTPSTIFVCNTGDLLGDWVPKDWIERVIKTVQLYPEHTFLFLTKNPARYKEFTFPENCWLGTSIDGLERNFDNAKLLLEANPLNKKFISFEPLLKDVLQQYIEQMQEIILEQVDWFIIGADSNVGANKPEQIWADKLIEFAKKNNIPVWLKDNLHYPKIIKEKPK